MWEEIRMIRRHSNAMRLIAQFNSRLRKPGIVKVSMICFNACIFKKIIINQIQCKRA